MSKQTPSFEPPSDPDLLLPLSAFKQAVAQQGKATPEVRKMIQESTSMFLHYIVDYAIQKRQNGDSNKIVTLRPVDIMIAIEELGFSTIAQKLRQWNFTSERPVHPAIFTDKYWLYVFVI